MEEVIDSSHHNLWEGQALPFPFWVTRVIILKILKGPTQELFLFLSDGEALESQSLIHCSTNKQLLLQPPLPRTVS